ncbi:MAG: hypothetical protein GQ468_05255 [Candidatus Scalindua sp.]|nr:hypothetical protein [Candidatus Scalindua sp.]
MGDYTQDSSAVDKQFLQKVFERNKFIEIRCLGSGKNPVLGIFNDYQKAEQAINKVSGMDIYFTVNPVLGNADNNIVRGRRGIADKDISHISMLPFDFDPVRETGIAATIEQVELACDHAERTIEYLGRRGWTNPIIGFSGNGFHLLYPVKLPNTDKTRRLLSALYLGLGNVITNDQIVFDTKVRNPSRIIRLYGTRNIKAKRLSTIYMTDMIMPVKYKVIRKTAIEVQPPPPPRKTPLDKAKMGNSGGRQGLHEWDIVGAMKKLGLYKRPLEQNKHAVQCVWSHEHTTKDEQAGTNTVVWDLNESGWANWYCSHDSCSGRNLVTVFKFCNNYK